MGNAMHYFEPVVESFIPNAMLANRCYGNRYDGNLAKVVFSIVECDDRQFVYTSMRMKING
jgi:hypothetical protein